MSKNILFSIKNAMGRNRMHINVRFFSHQTIQPNQPEMNTLSKPNPEVDHHSRLASEWWNPIGPLKGLHAMNTIRVPLVRDGLISTQKIDTTLQQTSKVLKGQNILEVGCGGGILTESLARLHANVTAIDLSDELVKVAKQHLVECSPELSSKINYKMEPLEVHVLDNLEKYDAVVVSEVLEHIDDKAAFLTNCVDTLKPGGSLFITTLNKTTIMWFTGIILAEYLLDLVPKGTHHWDKLIGPKELISILHAINCDTVLLKGCIYEFWSNKWQWIPIDDFSYALHAIKSEKS